MSSNSSSVFTTPEDITSKDYSSRDPVFNFSTDHEESESPVNTIFEETTKVLTTVSTVFNNISSNDLEVSSEQSTDSSFQSTTTINYSSASYNESTFFIHTTSDLSETSNNFTSEESIVTNPNSTNGSSTFSMFLSSVSETFETSLSNNSSVINQETTVTSTFTEDPTSFVNTSENPENSVSVNNEETSINLSSDISSTTKSPVPEVSSNFITSVNTKPSSTTDSDITTVNSIINESTIQISSASSKGSGFSEEVSSPIIQMTSQEPTSSYSPTSFEESFSSDTSTSFQYISSNTPTLSILSSSEIPTTPEKLFPSDTTNASEELSSDTLIPTEEPLSSEPLTSSEGPSSSTNPTPSEESFSSDNLTPLEDTASEIQITSELSSSLGSLITSEQPSPSDTPKSFDQIFSDIPAETGEQSSGTSTLNEQFFSPDNPTTTRQPDSSDTPDFSTEFSSSDTPAPFVELSSLFSSSMVQMHSEEPTSTDTPTPSKRALSSDTMPSTEEFSPDTPTSKRESFSDWTSSTEELSSDLQTEWFSTDTPPTTDESFSDSQASTEKFSSDSQTTEGFSTDTPLNTGEFSPSETPKSSDMTSSEIPTTSEEPFPSDTIKSFEESSSDPLVPSKHAFSSDPTTPSEESSSSGNLLPSVEPSSSDTPNPFDEFSSDIPMHSWEPSFDTQAENGQFSSPDNPIPTRQSPPSDTPTSSKQISSSDTPTPFTELSSSDTLLTSEELSSSIPQTPSEESTSPDTPTTYKELSSSDTSTPTMEFSSASLTPIMEFSSETPTSIGEFFSNTPPYTEDISSDSLATALNLSPSDTPTSTGQISSSTLMLSELPSSEIPTSTGKPFSSDTMKTFGESSFGTFMPSKETFPSDFLTPTKESSTTDNLTPLEDTSSSDIQTFSEVFSSSVDPTSFEESSSNLISSEESSSSDTTTPFDLLFSDTSAYLGESSSSASPSEESLSRNTMPSEESFSSDNPTPSDEPTSIQTPTEQSYSSDNPTPSGESSENLTSTREFFSDTPITSAETSSDSLTQSVEPSSSGNLISSEESPSSDTPTSFDELFSDIPSHTGESSSTATLFDASSSLSDNPVPSEISLSSENPTFSDEHSSLYSPTSSNESSLTDSISTEKSSTIPSSYSQATSITLVTNDSISHISPSTDKMTPFVTVSNGTESITNSNYDSTTISTLSDKETFSTKSLLMSTEFETTSSEKNSISFVTSSEEIVETPAVSFTLLSSPKTSVSKDFEESTDYLESSSAEITISVTEPNKPLTAIVTTSDQSMSPDSATSLFSKSVVAGKSTIPLSTETENVSRQSKSLTGDSSTQPTSLFNTTSVQSFPTTTTTANETISTISNIHTYSSNGTNSQETITGSIDITTTDSTSNVHETSSTAPFSESTTYLSNTESSESLTSLTDSKISTIPFDFANETTIFGSTSSFNPQCDCENCKSEDSKDCTKYFKCINGELISAQCPLGYLFNDLLNECDHADKVSCDLKTGRCPMGDGFYEDTEDCSSYIQCFDGIPYKRICPTGLLYNPTKRTCDTAFKCGTQPQLPTTRNYEIDCDCDNCAMPDSDDCSKYYLCLNNTAYELQCSEGLHFNPNTLTCDYNSSVSCAKYSSECLIKNGFFPMSGNCSKYYHCVGGVAHEKECEKNKHFSMSSERCEEPCDAECDTSLDCDTTTTVPFPNVCEEPNGFYPHPTSCRQFFKCENGKPTLAECVDSEHFSPTEHFCQDPCEAMCDLTLDCLSFSSTKPDVEDFTTVSISEEFLTTTTYQTEAHSTSIEDISSTPSESTQSETTTQITITSTTPIGISTEVITRQDPFTSSDKVTETGSTPTYSTSFDISRSSKSIQDETSSDGTSVSLTDADIVSEVSLPEESSFVLPINQSTTAEPDICAKGAGVYPKPGDCKSLIACVLGNKYEFQCPKGLHFSSISKHCEEPCEAKCDPTIDCITPEEPESSSPLPVTICPVKDLLPKKGHCNYYYDCTDGIRKKIKCPRGLHFNPTTRVCDFPSRANCGEPPGSLYWKDLYKVCNCETCLIPSTESCSDYYLCLNRTAYPMTCSRGLLFDKRKNTCNYGSETPCDIISTTTTTKKPTITTTKKHTVTSTTGTTTRKPTISSTKTTTTKPPTRSTKEQTPTSSTTTVTPRRYRCLKRYGLFENPDRCGSFIQCSNWWPYVKACPGSLHFSIETKRCEHPCDAKCDKNLHCVSTTEPTSTDATFDPLCACRNCFLPSEESCTKYIECKHGKVTKRTCPRGQTFDSKRQVCDWAHRVDCRHSEICLRRNGLFPYKGDCNKFVHCSNGIPYIKTCPANLHFDPEKVRCDWPSEKCESEGDVKGIVPHETEWKCPSSYGYFRSDKSCNQYYICIGGIPHLRSCPKNLVFNSKIRVCDWPQDTNCHGVQNYPQKRCRVYESSVQCHRNRTNLIHPDCDSFNDCTTGRACRKRCPDGLYYNANIDACDEPQNVRCKKSDGGLYSLEDFAEVCRTKRRGHMTDPSDATCFYRCNHSRVIRGCCSGNTVFEEIRNRCVWKYY